jgi:hypothetical protein
MLGTVKDASLEGGLYQACPFNPVQTTFVVLKTRSRFEVGRYVQFKWFGHGGVQSIAGSK